MGEFPVPEAEPRDEPVEPEPTPDPIAEEEAPASDASEIEVSSSEE